MEIRRFFVKPEDISDDIVLLRGDEFSHMIRTLRYKVGFKAVVLANDGKERLCEITSIGREEARLRILEVKDVARKTRSVTLFAGLLKNNKLDLVLQKAVELGVDKVVPFKSANTAESKFAKDRAERIAIESAKQCGAVYLSEVGELIDFDELLSVIEGYDDVVLAYEDERQTRISDIAFRGKNIAVIVGPEGGFTPEEAEAMRAHNAKVITLGTRILRAETASIVACALLLHLVGDLYE